MTRPDDGPSRPTIIRMVVDFPLPFGAEEASDPTGSDGERQVVNRQRLAVTLRQVHGLNHAGRSPCVRRAARSWNPAVAVASSRTPAPRPVVAASAEPDITATRTNGTTVKAQPTGRSLGMWTRWSSHSSSGPMVTAIDGRTQSLRPAAMTMTGNAKEATSSIMVAMLTDRSIRFAAGLVGRPPIPVLARTA